VICAMRTERSPQTARWGRFAKSSDRVFEGSVVIAALY
jgi:hypothetical protein